MTSSETAAPSGPAAATPGQLANPWPALFVLVLGFFMMLIDMTIVTVATPAIVGDLDAEVNSVVWVTSAYLLSYAVPVLITGRLGDRFGSRRIYLIGMVIFVGASFACGIATSIEWLIIARVVQGLGAAVMTPQTMAIITRIFPAESRGRAMAVWGATAGVAMVVGPVLGGILVDGLGWEWIFFVNVPIGIAAFVLALRFVPVLSTTNHRFDWIGVVLSGIGMFLLVFGIQEGHQKDWATWIWAMIIAGVVVMAIFIVWQRVNKAEPLVPLALFGDRNFSIGNFTISMVSLASNAMGFPLMLYAQVVRGLSPLQAALLMMPMAVVSLLGAPVVGRFTDKVHPRYLISAGFVATAGSFWWMTQILSFDQPYVVLCLPMLLLGVGNVLVWAPNAATTMRNLPMQLAGAGSGIYNATRQVGAVLGSALIAVIMDSRLAHYGLGAAGNPEAGGVGAALPHEVAVGFSSAMADSLYLAFAVTAIGLIAALMFERPHHQLN